MSNPELESAKCLKDILCVRACPTGTLRVGPLGYPEVTEGMSCVSCGHCVSVCPTMAMSRKEALSEDLEVLDEDFRIGPERVRQLLRGRRSTRDYREEPITRDTIEELIGTAQYAPSGHNMQPLSWTVVYERSQVRAIAEATVSWMRESVALETPYVSLMRIPEVLAGWESGRDVICRNAPHLIIAHGPEQQPSASHPAAIAITYLELAAASLGVGTCWAGFVFFGAAVSPKLHESLGLPNGQRCAGAVLVGWPALRHLRIPARRTPTISWR
jgi:nitroreductase/NAD-dependent dihydropyrimidine dehydrogenase PreA subunit